MCGIAGIISRDSSVIHRTPLTAMSDALAHRGPDGAAFWINEDHTVGFSHRRLAIIDLSEEAGQPMHYGDRYTIVYNGEIYNYKEIRSDLQKAGYRFRTKGDTEVIIAAYDFYGDSCVKYFDGMFSFSIWDARNSTLFCARDVFGEKPFFYFITKNIFAFASEMKALWAIGAERTPDEKMLVNYLALGYVQNAGNKSQSFFKNIYALPPAHTGLFSLRDMAFTVTRYRDINKEHTGKISETEATEKLSWLLESSVNYRLRSDVPVGSSLSGGLDSSSVAWFIQKQLRRNETAHSFKTFSAVFPGFAKDESALIKDAGGRLGFENFTVTPTADELVRDMKKLCWHQEEPFASSGIYAQYRVFQLASEQGVKVLLDGQGADEVLGGYDRYLHWYLQELTGKHKYIRAGKERKALHANAASVKWNIKNVFASYLPAHAALALEKKEYNKLVNNTVINASLLNEVKGKEWQGIYKPVVTKLNDILYHSTMEHGLEELLRYADRNSMAHGREVRLPFLNYDLVSFIFSLPASFKIRDGFTKFILRKAMQNRVPDNILWNAKKTGFEPPQKNWMQNDSLRDAMQDAKQKLVNAHILKPAVLNNKIVPLHAHDADNNDWRYLNLANII